MYSSRMSVFVHWCPFLAKNQPELEAPAGTSSFRGPVPWKRQLLAQAFQLLNASWKLLGASFQ